MNTWESLSIPMEAQAFALQVAVCGVFVCAMVLAVAGFLRRFSEPLRYGILLTGVIGLLAVPALVGVGRSCQTALPWSAAQPEDEVVKVPAEMLPELLERAGADGPEAPAEPASIGGPTLGAGLLALWALGAAIGACRLSCALWKQSRALIGLPWRADFWTDDLKGQLARKLGLRRFPRVHLSPAVPMPMVIGIWRPTIVLPEPGPASWGQPQWEAVLLHEAAHIARRDHWAALAQRLAVVFFWWCPLVHLLARRLNELRENICDDCALQGTCDRIAYAELLVESAEHFLNLKALAMPLGLLDSARGGLEARVARLLEKEKPTMTKLSLPGKLLGAALLGAACLLTTAGAAFSGGQPPPQKKVQIKIIVDGKEIDLTDAQLWNHIEAAQKKAAADKQFPLYFGIVGEADQAAKPGANGKPAAPNADWKVHVIEGGRLAVVDAQSGRIVAQVDKSKPGAPHIEYRVLPEPVPGTTDARLEYRWLGQLVQSKPDPRIEDLVKQAEAISPGSGAEIRRALQTVPKAGATPKDPNAVKPTPMIERLPPRTVVKPAPGMPGVPFWEDTVAEKKVIILAIEDGKVLRLNEADLRKLLDKGIRVHTDKDVQKQRADLEARRMELRRLDLLNKQSKDKAADTKPAPRPADLEALSRQLERLNAELNDLRKRLDAGKK